MFKADDYRLKIQGMRETLKEAEYALDIEHLRPRLAELEKEQENPEIWQDLEKSTKIGKEVSAIRNKIAAYEKGATALTDAEDVVDLIEETEDESLIAELDEMLAAAEKDIEDMRIRAILKGPYDNHNAMLALHAGAGGTEACDWCQMLYRMYCRYCEKMGFKVYEIDREAGDGAGFKSVDFRVEGENAYGYLKAEMGVHRLVRISPFDANKRRQTSFCSLEVMPEVEDDNEVEINDDDIRIDIYHSGGAGGQNVNKVASAVRITHFPTGIVVQCQNERSQLQNKAMCFAMLRSRLLEIKIQQRQAEAQEMKGDVKKIEWGSQIRSYVFCPYTMAKDHRTGYEKGDIQSVMDGEIHGFVIDYLKKS
ncbi:MAG: peptide chain release factor 2 [Clostridia bacterium]|nr:peptide chain release factor 2 [Clostridia bacterium]